mmetsp:Transcript_3104/g.4404  ORF Transcript_3104/g.4404 Transcript_3104/m.4404 type:complete len:268 (-) Transcript_3104:30-833(-)
MARMLLVAALATALAPGARGAFSPPCPSSSLHLAGARHALCQATAGQNILLQRGRLLPTQVTADKQGGTVGSLRGAGTLMMSDQRLVTKPRTSHAWFGVYFDIEAKDTPLTIKSIETGCSSSVDGKTLKVQLWATKEGSFAGKEEDASAWECLGDEEMVLSTIKFDKRAYDSSEAKYGKLPLKTDIVVESGGKRGFMIHTNSMGGLILRGGFGPEAQKNNWRVGAKSDETIHMRVLAGPVTASAPFTLEKDSPGFARAFAGSISYTI